MQLQIYTPMDVSYYGDGGFYVYDVSLTHEDLFGLLADFLEDCLVEELLLHELLYTCIQVERGHFQIRPKVGVETKMQLRP
jgi:hypothetical protein